MEAVYRRPMGVEIGNERSAQSNAACRLWASLFISYSTAHGHDFQDLLVWIMLRLQSRPLDEPLGST